MASALPSPPILESDRCVHDEHEDKMTSRSTQDDPLPLPQRFAKIKQKLIAGNEAAVLASWRRLLKQLKVEVESTSRAGSDILPTIHYDDICQDELSKEFLKRLKRHGAGVVRGVVPKKVATEWREETEAYLAHNSRLRATSTDEGRLCDIFWSPAQVKARSYTRVLDAQKFVMGLWRPSEPSAPVTTACPVTYADRIHLGGLGAPHSHQNCSVDGGSVERWEPDGYGEGSTYQQIWDGKWENYDPWDSSTRLLVTSDLYSGMGTCSMFRMFQGLLSLDEVHQDSGTLRLCPLIQLSTAYFLLRPFFSPVKNSPSHPDFLSPENWVLEPRTSSVIQGAVPSHMQELNDTLHPHLQLQGSMVQIPSLDPGDYVVWHCDSIYKIDRFEKGQTKNGNVSDKEASAVAMYLPACPLTQTNALYLARQRKAFLLGHPSPDFDSGGSGRGRAARGESYYLGRPGVQEVNDMGAKEGLRAMGLAPWDEEDVMSDAEADLLEVANNVLFPDRYEDDMSQ